MNSLPATPRANGSAPRFDDPVGPRTRFSDLVRVGSKPLRAMLGPRQSFAHGLKARACLYRLLCSLLPTSRRVVLVPTFHCPTIVQAIVKAGFDVRFYAVTDKLAVDEAHFLQQIDERVAAVIVIHFFGFKSSITTLAQVCRDNQTVLIEDWSHSFLRAAPLRLAGDTGDYALYSPWKLVPCGNGGLLRRLDNKPLAALSLNGAGAATTLRLYKSMFEDALAMLDERSLLRRAYFAFERMRTGQTQGARMRPHNERDAESGKQSALATLEDFYPNDDRLFTRKLPALCQRVLEHYDLAGMVAVRRANYRQLGGLLSELDGITPCFPELDEETCPWAFATRLPRRRGKDRQLRQLGVPFFTFGEFLHPLLNAADISNDARQTAEQLSAEMICFPVHQQIVPEAYAYYVDKIETVVQHEGSGRQ